MHLKTNVKMGTSKNSSVRKTLAVPINPNVLSCLEEEELSCMLMLKKEICS